MTDSLFSFIEQLQGDTPWGSVLDAGTGDHSLTWIDGLTTTRWAAVTTESAISSRLGPRFSPTMRPDDQLVAGDWRDPELLRGQTFDTVLVDYLVGALEGFAPYFQDRIFERLRPHVGQRLYMIGLTPFPDRSDDPDAQLLIDVAKARDACILHAGQRPYREYPSDWIVRRLEAAGFIVDSVRHFGNLFRLRFVDGQLSTARMKLPSIRDRTLRRALDQRLDALHARAKASPAFTRGVPLGSDYVIAARKAP